MKKKGSEKILNKYRWKNINALRRLSTKASKVGGKPSPRKFFWVNILYRNSFTLESDSRHKNNIHTYWIEVTTDGLSKESERNSPKSIVSVSSSSLFFNASNVVIFLVCEKLLTESHPHIAYIAGSKQHTVNSNSEATIRCVGIIPDRYRYQLKTILNLRM